MGGSLGPLLSIGFILMPELVSVGIPLTETLDGLTETLNSLLAQTYKSFEIILVPEHLFL